MVRNTRLGQDIAYLAANREQRAAAGGGVACRPGAYLGPVWQPLPYCPFVQLRPHDTWRICPAVHSVPGLAQEAGRWVGGRPSLAALLPLMTCSTALLVCLSTSCGRWLLSKHARAPPDRLRAP